jgi:RNA polymerase sigma-70 factor, ECF subfamily
MERNYPNTQLVEFEQGLTKFTHSLNLDIEERDLVRETLMNAVNKYSGYKADGYLKYWTDAMLQKAFVNNYKRIVLQNSPLNQNDLFMITRDENDADQESKFNNIIRNIEQLNYRLMEPFRMYVEGYSFSEIARRMNLKFETVAKRILIARSQLILKEI